MSDFQNPPDNCGRCPRLKEFRQLNQKRYPDKHNAPVVSFGSLESPLLILGLAPGLKGANFTGRPFTGDFAGNLLYQTLLKYGFATGKYEARADDSIALHRCRLTNAVRCLPPENKPTGDEIKNCQPFLEKEIAAMGNLQVILSLGKISHDAVLRCFGEKLSAHKFAHNAVHETGDITLVDSYHCSRYNTQTGRLTEAMFEAVFDTIENLLPA